MAIKATKFTPKVLLSAPRRSPGIPNADGSRILYTTHAYSFEDHEKTVEIRVLDVKSNESKLVSRHKELSEPNWLDEETVFLLESGLDGATNVLVGPIEDFDNQHYMAGEIRGPANTFKLKRINDGYAVAFSALAKPDGELYNPEAAARPHSTGRIYDNIWVRHWDRYRTRIRSAIWYSSIKKGINGRWGLSHIVNALQSTGLESPMPPFGGADNFDLSTSGLIFVAKDPDVNPALNTKCNIYLVPISSYTQLGIPTPIKVFSKSFDGAATCPVFSHDGRCAAFLAMEKNGYEADRNQLFLIRDVNQPAAALHWASQDRGDGKFWDRSPSSVTWSTDSGTLYLTAEDEGKASLFAVISADLPGPIRKLTQDGSVTGEFHERFLNFASNCHILFSCLQSISLHLIPNYSLENT